MIKRTNLRGAAFMLTLTIFLVGPVLAQNQKPQFKVGDRVEMDTLYSENPEKSEFWQKGTIVKMDDPGEHFGSYTIKLDKDSRVITTRFIDTRWIRQLTGANDTAGNQTTPEAKSCSPSDETGGKSQADIFKRLIRSRYEHKPENDRDETATVTFQTFKLGAEYEWRPGLPGGSSDNSIVKAGTIIHPVKAVYTVCKDHPAFKPTGYAGEIQTRQDDNTFYCFKDRFGDWVCYLGEGKTGKTKFITK